jgi:hypothetical protein
MSRKLIVILTTLIIASAAFIAYAGNVHFVGSISTVGGSFVVKGKVAGLGNGSFTFNLIAYADVTAICRSKEGHTVPGYKPISVATTDSYVSKSNGHTNVYLHAPEPSWKSLPKPPTPKEAGCPSGYWTVVGLKPHSTYWKGADLSAVNNANDDEVLQISWTCSGTPESCIEN